MHCKFLVFLLIVFFFFLFFSSACEFWLIERIGAPGKQNPDCSDRILTFGIRSILSPAKGGTGYYKAVNYQPGS